MPTRCETANYVSSYDPTASASCAEFSPTAAHLAHRSLHHEVQRLTLQQAGPAKLVQYITFAAIECNLTATADCIARETDTVKLVYAGVESPYAVSLNASSVTISASFATLVDSSYSGLEETVELINATHVVWRLELLTTWEVCTTPTSSPSYPYPHPNIDSDPDPNPTLTLTLP